MPREPIYPTFAPNSAQVHLQGKVSPAKLATKINPNISSPRLKALHAQFNKYFLETIPKAEAALESKDHKGLFKIAHNLRGEAATLGFHNTGQIAGRLVTMLREGPPASWRAVHAHILVLKGISEAGQDRLPAGILDRLGKLV